MRSPRAAITVVFFADGLLLGSWAARVAAVQRQAGLSNAQLGVALFAASLGALLAMPGAGRLCGRIGSRTVAVGALAIAAASLALAGASTGFAALALSLFGFGVGFGSVNVAANDQGIALERRRERSILSSFHAAFSAGGLAGAGVGALVAGVGVAPRAHLGVAGALVIVAALLCRTSLIETRSEVTAPRRVLARPPGLVLVLGIAAFGTLLAEGSVADWSSVYLSRSLATSAALAGAGYTCFSLAMFASRVLGDRLVTRLGPVVVARGGAMVAALGLTSALVVATPPAALAGYAATGAGLGVIVPVLFRAAGSAPGMSRSDGVATVSTIGWLGFLAGPAAIGLVATATTLRVALAIVVVALVTVILTAGAAGRTRRERRRAVVSAPAVGSTGVHAR
ncbi:MAG: MFS transporter [Candidatus Dormibacteria bacterium]